MKHLSQLSLDDCRLLSQLDSSDCQQVVKLYNDVLEFYQRLQSECPPPTADDKIVPMQADLKRIYERLTRQRYQVGFLGPFQGGKSTTFNRILNPRPGEEPSKEGPGEATTATVTRLVATTHGKHQLRLRYLLESEFRERRADMCVAVQLPPTASDQESMQQAGALIREMEKTGNDPDKLRSLKKLVRFLKSYADFKSNLRDREDVRLVESADWEQRARLLNHPPRDAPLNASPTLLLESAQIEYVTKAIPPELELIDLPGLGSINVFDDKLTQSYIKHLDGAIVFTRAETIEDRHVSDFLQALRGVWTSLVGRAWLCFTKSDSLGDAHFNQDYFGGVSKFAEDRKLPLDQICFISNRTDLLKDRFREQPSLQAAEMAPLCEAWKGLYVDGGIARLSQIVLGDVPRLVGEGILREAERELRRLGRELVRLAKIELGDAGNNDEQLNHARSCLNGVSAIAVKVAKEKTWFKDEAEELRQELDEALQDLNIHPDVLEDLPDFGRHFRQHAGTLEATLHRRVRRDLTKRAYQDVLAHLHPLEQLQRMRLPGNAEEGLVVAWEGFQADDETSTAWYGKDFPSFLLNEPVDGLDDRANPFNGHEYIDLLSRKIRVVSHQTVQKLRRRLSDRLRGLMDALNEFATRDYAQSQRARSEGFEQLVNEYEARFAR